MKNIHRMSFISKRSCRRFATRASSCQARQNSDYVMVYITSSFGLVSNCNRLNHNQPRIRCGQTDRKAYNFDHSANMHLLRASPILRSVGARSSPRITTRTTIPIQHRLYAQQSYGGADDDPKGGDPQKQGSNPSADLEHPGPPPPDVGKGTGGGPTKAGSGGHNTQQNESSSGSGSGSGSGSKGEVSSGGKKASNGAQPKIHSSKVPEDHEESEDVKQHNKEMDNRRLGGAQNKQDDGGKHDVGKGFWSGETGPIFTCLYTMS